MLKNENHVMLIVHLLIDMDDKQCNPSTPSTFAPLKQ